MARKYLLKVFVSAKHMTANVVVDGNNQGRVVASASTVEQTIKDAFEWGRSCNAKAAACIGEVLAMRLKTEEPVLGLGGEVHMDVEKEIEKKDLDTGPEVWAVVNSLRKRGVKVVVHNHHSIASKS